MCTVGVLRFDDDSYVLFKNKDFRRPTFDDQIVLERSVFGVSGLVTWAGDDASLDEFSGFSFGANAHGLLCCDANVKTVPGNANYDDLVEIALRDSSNFVDAVEAVADAVARQPYHWGNLVLIDGDLAGAIEVRGDRIEVVVNDGPTIRTNHHVALGATVGDDNTTTSTPRYDAALRLIDDASSIDDLSDLMRSHENGAGGICVHGAHQTVYSYVLHHDRDGIALSVTRGPPCQTSPQVVLELPFGDSSSTAATDAFREAYPSERSSFPD